MVVQTSDIYWQRSQAELFADLQTSTQGLTANEASSRLNQFGENRLQMRSRRNLWLDVQSRLTNPLILLLLFAGLLSAAIGERIDALIIATIVLLSIFLDVTQESHAHRAAEKLKETIALQSQVIRDGESILIPSSELVVGDIVTVEAGDLVPADGVLLEATDFFVNEAALTGESFPVQKHADSAPKLNELESLRVIFLGTSVIAGTATFVVCRTGAATQFGQIARTLLAPAPPTSFETGIRKLGLLLMRVAMIMVPFALAVNLGLGRSWLTSCMFSIALAVGLTPELLPMILSIALARGATRMARKKVIVKRLSAIEDLGSMNVLCTDKTGTLTEANIQMERYIAPFGEPAKQVLELAYLNSFFHTGMGNPLDQAILHSEPIDVAGWEKLGEIPFDFERRRTSTLVSHGTDRLLITKGAPETLLACCNALQEPSGAIRPLVLRERELLEERVVDFSTQGFRVLAVAYRHMESTSPTREDERELIFVGFLVFFDPPKKSARPAIHAIHKSGIEIKIITGDNAPVTQALCGALQIDIKGLLLGSEIENMTDSALEAQAPQTTLFCRVTPAQKNRIILALKARGSIVGFLGDGVNDAAAIKTADVGISVSTAADVAKESADMVLMERNLTVLHQGILEGRRTFANVVKYLLMSTSSNFGNMLSMAMAVLILPYLPMLPVQILLNNLLYDLSQIAIPMDRVERRQLLKPQHWNIPSIRAFMLLAGPISSLFDFLLFAILIFGFQASAPLFHTAWFIESAFTQVLVIFFLRTPDNPFRSRPHPLLWMTALLIVAIAIALPYSPLGPLLGFIKLPPPFFAVLVLISAGYFACIERIKRWYYNKFYYISPPQFSPSFKQL